MQRDRGRKFNRHGYRNTTSKMIAADTANGIRRENINNIIATTATFKRHFSLKRLTASSCMQPGCNSEFVESSAATLIENYLFSETDIFRQIKSILT